MDILPWEACQEPVYYISKHFTLFAGRVFQAILYAHHTLAIRDFLGMREYLEHWLASEYTLTPVCRRSLVDYLTVHPRQLILLTIEGMTFCYRAPGKYTALILHVDARVAEFCLRYRHRGLGCLSNRRHVGCE